ncbi:extracellular solute-binding protein [Yoonia sp. 208BN28-4]|uniref:extracellular solute-binding protein n=1 Tax=Yoonia sp. 208BN28-4 TaxID=3126505 RepID=UPI0030A74BAB
MQNRHQTKAVTKAKQQSMLHLKYVLLGSAVCVAGAIWAGQALADAHIIETHGFNEYDALKYGPDFEHLDYVNPDAPVGGEISISANGSFDSMTPYATLEGTPGSLASIGYETIMAPTEDEIGSSYCVLCTTIEYPEDKAWLQINLRDDVTFSDGSPMTAADVAYTHELLLTQSTPSYAAGLQELVPSYEVIDDYTIRFDFNPERPLRARIGQMTGMPVFSKAWFEENEARLDEASLTAPMTTGEYVVGNVDPGRQIIYERNPDYWGADHPMNVGRGNYDRIRIEYFADSSAAFEAFKAGEFTFRRENSSLIWATSYDFPAIENGWVVQDTLDDNSPPFVTGFVFNLRDPKFQDRNLRRALGMMFNFTWTNNNLQYGLFQQRESFWENDRLKATGLPEGRELEMLETVRDLVPERIFTEPAALPHESGDSPVDRGNLRTALGLMEEAGYTPNADGLLADADGNVLTVEFLETRPSFDRIITPYIENLKRLGVDATYNRVDSAQYQSRTQTNDFEMLFGVYRSGLLEGTGLSQRYGCEDKDDVFNPAGFCSEAVDALSKFVENADNFDEMAAGVMAIDRIMRDEYFIVPTWYLGKFWVAYYDMYEYPENLPEFGLGYLDYWWYNEDKAAELRAAGALR